MPDPHARALELLGEMEARHKLGDSGGKGSFNAFTAAHWNDSPRAYRALREVLGLHYPKARGRSARRRTTDVFCDVCDDFHPCPTVRAITRALEGEPNAYPDRVITDDPHSMPDPTPRERIETWLEEAVAIGRRSERVIRAALAIIDAEHPPGGCNSTCAEPGKPWVCPRKAEHEARLWEAING